MGLGPHLFSPPEIFSPYIWTRRCLLLPSLPFLALGQQQSDSVVLFCVPQANAAPDSPRTWLARGSWQGRLAAPAMPHFLDWFVPVYLMISILILVGFGACIYYFEPGLQEAHKWRTQRPIMERDLRKTLMIRDNLAFGVPEV
uniref:Small integral membrane protein 45 n=1 Tax=Taeniopygia guttata TaxID=59729 RepID=A0A674GC50_TAEGU